MKIKELFVSVEAKVTGLKKLEAFNEALKGIMASYRQLYSLTNTLQKSSTKAVEKTVEAGGSSNTGKANIFSRFFKAAPNIAAILQIANAAYKAVKALVSFAISASKSAYELIKLRNNLGLSTTRLQEFGNAAVASGVKLGDFQSAVAGLRKNSVDILLGRGDITPYALLGLNPHDDPMVFLEKLQGRLRELPEALGTAFATDLGLSPDMINFVRSADFRRLRERPTLSRSEVNQMKELRDSALELVVAFQTFSQKATVFFAPIIKNIFEPLTKFFQSAIRDTFVLKKAFVGTMYAAALGAATYNKGLGVLIASLTTIGIIVEDLMKGGEGIQLWISYIKEILLDAVKEVGDAIHDWFNFGQGSNLGTGSAPVGGFGLTEEQIQDQLDAQERISRQARLNKAGGIGNEYLFKNWFKDEVLAPMVAVGKYGIPTGDTTVKDLINKWNTDYRLHEVLMRNLTGRLEFSFSGGSIPLTLGDKKVGEVPMTSFKLDNGLGIDASESPMTGIKP